MSGSPSQKKTLRRQLFGSHLLVIAVALVVLAIVVGSWNLISDGRGLGSSGRRNGSGSGPGVALVGLAIAATSAAFVSWRLARKLAEPLEAVGAATRELAAGRYGISVPGSEVVELDALATDVGRLAHELETTEQRRLRLIGDVAHELRNPLTTIEGTMEALLDGVMPAEDETFERIARESARLRRLADDLSSLSAAGEPGALDREVVDLGALASNVVSQLEPQASAKGLSLTVEGAATVRTRGDHDRLTQVLMNVVGNAVQYTDAGLIAVRVSSSANAEARSLSVIEIEDTGRGLASDDVERVFERFHRVDDQFTDGTGVGLAIAQLIVEAHGGRISARSSGLGTGSTFRIEFSNEA